MTGMIVNLMGVLIVNIISGIWMNVCHTNLIISTRKQIHAYQNARNVLILTEEKYREKKQKDLDLGMILL
ncbi:MAG: hypothetical protein A2054_03170 [Deltaproteobacteria bacterium GWA2_55_10]|nr:MAG: hypothetical protein A2054_03170 [Deltaproteobacteria bacterium GWA2_55_10]